MSTAPPTLPRCYRFADYELDPASGELRRGEPSPGDTVRRLEPQPARVLVELLRRSGEVVPRAELQRAVWGDSHVERDQGLNYCVRQIRAVLGDEAAEPRFLETLPRRGYRFLVPVTGGSVPLPRRRRWGLAAGLGLATVALGLGWVAWRGTTPPEPVRLALRPFVVTDAAPGEAAGLAAGADRLGERLLSALVGVPALDVVGPATTAGHALADPELASALGVDHVVSGAVRPPTAGEPGTVFAQVTRGADGGHLFGRRFAYRDLADGGDLATLCGEIVGEVLTTLQAETPRLDHAPPAELCRR